MTLEQDILKKIKPSPERREQIQRTVRSILSRTQEEATRADLGLEVILVGSVAKDTFLQEPDIDVFLLFPENVPRARLEAVGLEIGRKVLGEGEEHYAEHPYIHGHWEGLEVDMVPCYGLKDTTKLMSAVDRTPFHTRFIKEHLKEEQKDQVRLLKQFAKGIGVYGAEAKTQGLSGYLLELLILRYGTFSGVLAAASEWTKGTVLSLDGKGGKAFGEPLVFYDPIDNKRNVASALSTHSLAVFIHASRSYRQEPSERYFFPRPRPIMEVSAAEEQLRVRGTGVVVVSLARPELIDDNLYPQVRRTMEGMLSLLGSNEFMVVDHAWVVGETVRFVIELESLQLSPARKHVGPPMWIDNSKPFLERWEQEGISRPFLENGHWAVIAPREHPEAAGLLRSKLATTALGSAFRELRGLHVQMGQDALNEGNRSVLTALLDKRMRWEI